MRCTFLLNLGAHNTVETGLVSDVRGAIHGVNDVNVLGSCSERTKQLMHQTPVMDQ